LLVAVIASSVVSEASAIKEATFNALQYLNRHALHPPLLILLNERVIPLMVIAQDIASPVILIVVVCFSFLHLINPHR
jgi:hypothetical protein